MTQTKPSKREVFDAMLERSTDRSMYVLFRTDRVGTSLPAHLKPHAYVCLEMGHGMIVPIKGLLSHVGGFSGTFSFNRVPAYVNVPWAAVFWIGRDYGSPSELGIGWPDDAPEDVKAVMTEVRARPGARGGSIAGRVRELPKGWRVINGGNDAPSGPNTRGVS